MVRRDKHFTKDILGFQQQLMNIGLKHWFQKSAHEINAGIILKHVTYHAQRRIAYNNGWHTKCGKPMRDYLSKTGDTSNRAPISAL